MLTYVKKVCNPFGGSAISRKNIDIYRYALTGWGEEWETIGVIWFCVNGIVSRYIEGEYERRIYDDAKTPWQRVLLSGVLPEETQQKRREDVEALDPLRLVQHVEVLQRAVWRCAEADPGGVLVHFSLGACLSAAACSDQRALSEVLAQGASSAELRDWSRSAEPVCTNAISSRKEAAPAHY
jgi:hypothetical protein